MGDRALSVAGPRAWNTLPADIRSALSLDTKSVSNHICFLLLTIYNNIFIFSNCLLICIFTALHGMQTRSCDENSVCLSVRLSHACIVTKR